MRKLALFLTLSLLAAVSCSKEFDDSRIWDKLNDHESRIEYLETLCGQMNTNIKALQTTVAALQDNDYVQSIVPLMVDSKAVGYTITFTKSGAVNIYHGKDGINGTDGANGKDGQNGADGKDGHNPIVSVKKDSDGIYYWTLDGEWLLDENGSKVKAVGIDGKDGTNGTNGTDGKDGQDAITPLLKIENDYWHISYDNGFSWSQLGKATGEKGDKGDAGLVGDSMFTDIDYSNDYYVIFTLSNGTQIKMPTWYAFEQLQMLCNEMNTNISSLQTIIAALQNNDYVQSIVPLMEDSKAVGYTITFTKSGAVNIYHGKDGINGTDGANGKDGQNGADGKDGHNPIVSVKKDSDGIYYWTLDGEWLLDENGSKVKAVGIDGKDGTNGTNGTDGKDGQDAITPLLKIENDYWHISYDNGFSWSQLGKATGEKGDSFFQSLSQDEQFVYFTLATGTVITLPKGVTLDITFADNDLVVMSPNSIHSISYSVLSVTENVTVEVISSSDIRAKVVAVDATGKSGRIEIKSSTALDEYSKVIVFVSNGEKVIMKSISFEQARLEISDGAKQKISAEGGNISLNFMTNVNWEVHIPTSAQNWISPVPQTRALTPYTAILNIAPNTSLSERSAIVNIISKDGKLSISYTITQGVFNNVVITTYNEEGWKHGDTISVFASNTTNQRYTYYDATGATTGVFLASALEDTNQVHVNGYYAVYPYNTAYTLFTDGKLTIPFLAKQPYVEGGYSPALNTMIGVSQNTTNTDIILRPLGAYLCVKLWGKEQTIKSIVITSKGGETIAGSAIVIPVYNANPTCTMSGNENSITMNCQELIVGSTESSATSFWFVVPPVALSSGYTVKVVGFYGGEQVIDHEATTFVSGTTYNVTAELTISSDGPGIGVGGWGNGENIGGEI